MKKIVLFFAAIIFASTTVPAEESVPPTDDMLIKFVQQRTNAVRITQSPYQMETFVMMRCTGPSPEEIRDAQKEKSLGISDPHIKKYVHVYVSQNGEAAMRTNSEIFPQGSIVLKEKFSDAEGKQTELFTGMIKREAGYILNAVIGNFSLCQVTLRKFQSAENFKTAWIAMLNTKKAIT